MGNLSPLFSSPAAMHILSLLILNSDRTYYQSEIVAEVGYAQIQVQRALLRLEQTELIIKSKQGRMVYYQANHQHVGFEDLKSFFEKTLGYVHKLRASITSFEDDVSFAFIYGSMAAGTESQESDIDLLLITGLSLRHLMNKIGPVGRNLKRELNITSYSKSEFLQKLKEGNHFISDVVSNPKIWLKGNDNDFGKFLE